MPPKEQARHGNAQHSNVAPTAAPEMTLKQQFERGMISKEEYAEIVAKMSPLQQRRHGIITKTEADELVRHQLRIATRSIAKNEEYRVIKERIDRTYGEINGIVWNYDSGLRYYPRTSKSILDILAFFNADFYTPENHPIFQYLCNRPGMRYKPTFLLKSTFSFLFRCGFNVFSRKVLNGLDWDCVWFFKTTLQFHYVNDNDPDRQYRRIEADYDFTDVKVFSLDGHYYILIDEVCHNPEVRKALNILRAAKCTYDRDVCAQEDGSVIYTFATDIAYRERWNDYYMDGEWPQSYQVYINLFRLRFALWNDDSSYIERQFRPHATWIRGEKLEQLKRSMISI